MSSLETVFVATNGSSVQAASHVKDCSVIVAEMLLLRGNVEANPGPSLPEEQARVDGKPFIQRVLNKVVRFS